MPLWSLHSREGKTNNKHHKEVNDMVCYKVTSDKGEIEQGKEN